MSRWATLKAVQTLDWRTEWQEIARITLTAEAVSASAPPSELAGILDRLDSAYHRQDKVGFIALKAQLVKHPWCAGSSPSSNSNPTPTAGKSEAMPPVSDAPTLWDATTDTSSG